MKLFLRIVFWLFSLQMWGQQSQWINADRPDQSEGIQALLHKKWQIEGGVSLLKNNVSVNSMLRYGAFKKGEIRLETNVFQNVVSDATLSVRYHIFNGKNELPSVALFGYASYSSENESVSPDVLIAFENELSEKWALVYNVGAFEKFQKLLITTELNYSFSERATLFAEYYGYFSKEKPEHNFDGGIMYFFKSNFQIDTSVTYSLSEKNIMFTLGMAYRF